jgi:hypothetical protein
MSLRIKKYVVTALMVGSIVKCLSTAQLPWLASSVILMGATYIAHGTPHPLSYKRKLGELAEQQQTLEELRWQLEEQLQAVEQEKGALTVKTEAYAIELRDSATQQVQEIVEDYEARINMAQQERILLESKIDYLLEKIDTLQAPKLPTASDPASLLTSKLCTVLLEVGCAVDYERCWYDGGQVIAWITPRKGGVKAVSKYTDEIHLRLSLTTKPLITVINGVVQVAMTPLAYSTEPDENTPLKQLYSQSTNDMRKRLTQAWTKEAAPRVVGFIEPLIVFHPVGAVCQLEREWILHCHYKGFNEQRTIARVYGVTGSKSTQIYKACHERYQQVIEELDT